MPVPLEVFRFVHDTHPAATELLQDAWFGRSCVHFPVGTWRFNSSNQVCTTTICVKDVVSFGLIIRNRWPSGDASQYGNVIAVGTYGP
jgi:hypothetical protein